MPDQEVVGFSSRVYQTQWYSIPALTLETPALRVTTVPMIGAKIVSVFDRIAGREWLLPSNDGRFQPVAYAASFVEQDMSGWDEMFPTIERCVYPVEGAYFGAELPDHGEVWALAWKHDENIMDGVCLRVSGRVLPYTLSRTLRVVGERTLRLSYEVVNTGDEPLVALWATHPQFNVDDTTRIVLPDTVQHVINVLPTEELPATGQLCAWATTTTPAGERLQLDRIGSASGHKHRKLYLPPEQPVSWAGLQQSGDGAWLRLSWDTNAVPYLGVWVDEGAFNSAATAALEPSTGYYDSLTRAWQNNRVVRLIPNSMCRWSLDLELGSGQIS
ncbi:MAG: hypothetical protein IT319_21375 [Anaerolineae bacterium]|nr:hypothetical protein [Anaerolineae bacterium]